jgi:hypothetical protein
MARDFDSLIAVLHADVLDAPSGLTPHAIAENLGFKRYTTFMNQLEQQEGFKLDANMVLPVSLQAGSKRALHYLADRLGCVVIDLPEAVLGMEPLSMQAIQSVKEVGDVMEAYLKAAGDGTIDRGDKKDVRKEIYEAVAALMTFAKSLEAV